MKLAACKMIPYCSTSTPFSDHVTNVTAPTNIDIFIIDGKSAF
jgi:hypothetical protein